MKNWSWSSLTELNLAFAQLLEPWPMFAPRPGLSAPAREAGGSSHRPGQTQDVVIAPPNHPRVHQDTNVSVQK